jgi:phospholipase A1
MKTLTHLSLVAFPYDWRKSNCIAAQALAAKLDELVERHHGQADILLIGHSMGGLIARYYLESGHFDSRPAWGAVRKLVTLGTPHRGAPLALTAALGLEKRLFLSAAQVRQIANDSRYPAVYELLPPVGEPFAWDVGSELSQLDVYDSSIAQALGLNQSNLETARAFHAGLNPTRRPSHVRYFFFFRNPDDNHCERSIAESTSRISS